MAQHTGVCHKLNTCTLSTSSASFPWCWTGQCKCLEGQFEGLWREKRHRGLSTAGRSPDAKGGGAPPAALTVLLVDNHLTMEEREWGGLGSG